MCIFCLPCLKKQNPAWHATDSLLLISFQKEASGALTHAGAHLDLSAFSSAEVSRFFGPFAVSLSSLVESRGAKLDRGVSWAKIGVQKYFEACRFMFQCSVLMYIGVGVSGTGSSEVGSDGLGTQMWRVSPRNEVTMLPKRHE